MSNTPYTEQANRSLLFLYFDDLPEKLQNDLLEIHKVIKETAYDLMDDPDFDSIRDENWTKNALAEFCSPPFHHDDVGSAQIGKEKNKFECMVQITGRPKNHRNTREQETFAFFIKTLHKKVKRIVERKYAVRITSEAAEGKPYEGFNVSPKINIAKDIFEQSLKSMKPVTEATETARPESPKKMMRIISQSLMAKFEKDQKMTANDAKLFSNFITENLLPQWAPGYQKFVIILDDYQSFHTVEFKIPKITSDFVARFVEGRETIGGFLHRTPEIKMKISPRVFERIKSPDDPFNFFRAALKYYSNDIERYALRLMTEVKRLPIETRQLIETTKLSGIVTYPLSILFTFDDVGIDQSGIFRISNEDLKAINTFVRGITTKYAEPEKMKSQIVNDVKELVKSLHECTGINDANRDLVYLPEAVEQYFEGGFSEEMQRARFIFESEQIDRTWKESAPYQVQYLQEKFGVKKLKKIPRDIVAYITIEGESIRTANDKMMIASYCLGKIEIVEWYIELIDTGSKKYIVPHDKNYLVDLRTQLLACYKKIMDTPIPKNRPIIDIQYPTGFEG